MVRAPYPARIAAGLIVTAIEETRKLPALMFTLPMTAVSQTLQAGMRMQQGIAELAIKGDAVFDMLFERPSEQPEWARFDEDDDAHDTEAARTPIESRSASSGRSLRSVDDAASPEHTAFVTKHTEAPSATTDAAPADIPQTPDTSAGRFALYSSPPEDVVAKNGADDTADGFDGAVPEIVEYLEYGNLTLAQLRAKLRTVSLPELEDLLAYEKATKARAPFVTMIDNRIASHTKRPSST